MAKRERVRDPIPDHFESIEEAAEFWDSHDLTDYLDLTEEVEFEVDLQQRQHLVAVDPELVQKVAAEAQKRGLSTETLVNLWLQDKLQESAA